MYRYTFTSIYVVSLTVLSISAADVFIINAKPSERESQTLPDQRATQKTQVLSNNDRVSKYYPLRPASSRDLTKADVAELLRLLSKNNAKTPTKKALRDVQYRLYRNIGNKHSYEYRKPRLFETNSKRLKPLLQYILANTNPNYKKYQGLTGLDLSNLNEEYSDIDELASNTQMDRFSRDYIDLDSLKFRRNQRKRKMAKPALRSYSVESSNENSNENRALKRFNIIKNKNNKKDIKSDEIDEVKTKKKKATFKRKAKKVTSTEKAGLSLSAESDKEKSKAERNESPEKKKKYASDENDEWHDENEPIAYLLQGNKLTMYPPMDKGSSENEDDETRKRGSDRLPYFMPKRYHWTADDIHDLGYFFFNGPKGLSLERE